MRTENQSTIICCIIVGIACVAVTSILNRRRLNELEKYVTGKVASIQQLESIAVDHGHKLNNLFNGVPIPPAASELTEWTPPFLGADKPPETADAIKLRPQLADSDLAALAKNIIAHVDHPSMQDAPKDERIALVKDVLHNTLYAKGLIGEYQGQ